MQLGKRAFPAVAFLLGAVLSNVVFAGQGAIYSSGQVLTFGGTLPGTCNVGELYAKNTTTIGLYVCSASNTWTAAGGGLPLTGTGATVTTSTPLLDLSQTWNASGTTFTGVLVNITNTASQSTSKLLDVQVGGATQFNVTRAGTVQASTNLFSNSSQLTVKSTASIGWSSTTNAYDAQDVWLYRDAANTLALRNSTNAQTFNLYNTYTDASNYERLELNTATVANTYMIRGAQAGTGSYRELRIAYTNSTNIAFAVQRIGVNPISIGQHGSNDMINHATNPSVLFGGSGSGTAATSGNYIGVRVQYNASPASTSTAVLVPFSLTPTINYSNATPGAGSYEALKIAVTETALPTGTNYLIRASAGSAGTTDRFTVTNSGLTTGFHFTGNGTAPTVGNTSANSCGTTAATIAGTDQGGKVTVGATSGTSCTVTFGTAWANAPACWGNNETTANLMRSTSTTTTLILAGTMVGGDVISYGCFGY